MKQKLLALVCALALVVSLAGCVISTPDTVGSLGDYEISSGLYLLAQYDAYQKAADLASSDQDAANVKAFFEADHHRGQRQRRDGHRQRLCRPENAGEPADLRRH